MCVWGGRQHITNKTHGTQAIPLRKNVAADSPGLFLVVMALVDDHLLLSKGATSPCPWSSSGKSLALVSSYIWILAMGDIGVKKKRLEGGGGEIVF